MPAIRSIWARFPFTQVFFVIMAFGILVTSNYFFSVSRERHYLHDGTESTFVSIENQLEYNLMEPRSILGIVSESIRGLILRGGSADDVHEYLIDITRYSQDKINGFVSILAVCDVFDGAIIDGLDRDPGPDYVPSERLWHRAATEAEGGIGVTEPYIDWVSKEVTISYARSIFDTDGNRLAVINLDIDMDRIYQLSLEMQEDKTSYWLLLDKEFTTIAHPEPSLLGVKFNLTSDEMDVIAKDLADGTEIFERPFTNYQGEESLLSIRTLPNGWHIGVVTPSQKYYENLRRTQWFFIVIGLFVSLGLITILVRVTNKKNKAEDQSRITYDILNALDAMIYATDPETNRILFINERMKTHFNLDNNSIGKICYKILQKDLDEKCDFCPCHQLDKNSGIPVVWERRSTLTNRTYRNTDRYIEWYDGKTVHLQHSVDITELIEAKELAEQHSRYKSLFLAHMSHEIRTPLNAVLGIAEIQLQSPNMPPEAEDSFAQIYDSSSLLLNIINDILDLSKIEAGHLELSLAPYDIPSLIYDTTQLNYLRFESKPINFVVKINQNTPLDLHGDELRIKQILSNLLSNAFKYTEKGEVELSVYSKEADSGDDSDVTLVFRVSDTGYGMTAEQIEKLFDNYTRFHLHTKRTVAGAGLGMGITRYLVGLMNGEITVESEPDKGSVFTVRIPQKRIGTNICGSEFGDGMNSLLYNLRSRSMDKIKNKQFIREHMPYGRVLLVDDVGSNLYVAKGMLMPYGLEIETATKGRDAVAKIADGNEYDIIFMDHMMPEMDGIEAVKLIREMGYNRTIVALTANVIIGQSEVFLQNGFDGFLPKPIDSRQLNTILNEYIRDKHPDKKTVKRPKAASVLPDVKAVFIKDAKNTVEIISRVYDGVIAGGESEIKQYITAVHGIKNALAVINESRLSSLAYKLEQAAISRDTDTIRDETKVLLEGLGQLTVDN
ncbi:MAG: ATP-binding protein [Oscillospiraceae bacterium]|nr:ATP-binding protein [Oscillospiraceae bacterium]